MNTDWLKEGQRMGDTDWLKEGQRMGEYRLIQGFFLSFLSRFGLAVRRYAGKQRDFCSNPLRLSFLFESCGQRTPS